MFELLKDLWDFMRVRKKFWLAPIILIMLLLGSLLVLNRPDFAFTVLPFAVALLPRLRDSLSRRAIALGALPLVIWIVFAFLYYGDLAPNPAYAKVGILPTWWDGILQGGIYLGDWIRHEPIPAFSTGLRTPKRL